MEQEHQPQEHEPQPQPREFFPDKIVRDNIPQMHLDDGWYVNAFPVFRAELDWRLIAKLEAEFSELERLLIHEFTEERRAEVVDEIVDIRTAQRRISERILRVEDSNSVEQTIKRAVIKYSIAKRELDEHYHKKKLRVGDFSQGIVLEHIIAGPDVPEDDRFLIKYRRDAIRDPELLSPRVRRRR